MREILKRDQDILYDLKLLSETIAPEVRAFRIVACLADSKGNKLSFGFPRRRSHTLQKQMSLDDNKIFLHAEVDCIIRGLRKISVEERKDCSLYIHRSKMKLKEGSHDEFVWVNGLSRPCTACSKLIDKIDLTKVIYSTEQGYESL